MTRQPEPDGEDSITLGLPAPGRWGRRRLALSVARKDVLYFDEFPLAEKLLGPRPDTGARDELQRFVDRYRDWLGHDRLAARQSGQSASNARS